MAEKKEPMIGQESRPTAIDFDMPIANFKLRDLYAVIQAHPEFLKLEKEHLKGEKEKEHLKTEKEHFKEKEYFKSEKEKEHFKEKEYFKGDHFKPEKEALKPEKEGFKPEKPIDRGFVEEVAARVVSILREQKVIK